MPLILITLLRDTVTIKTVSTRMPVFVSKIYFFRPFGYQSL